MKPAAPILVLLCASVPARAADFFLLSAGASYNRHADASYRATYGRGAVQPEFEVGLRIRRGFFVMGGYGAISGSGKIPDLGLDARSTQSYLSAGLGFIHPISGPLEFKLEAGLAELMYTEETAGLRFSGNRLGYQAEAGLLVTGKVVFTEIKVGYMAASDTVGEVKFKLGGARIGLMAGIRL
jgi:hypothetical protein